MRKKGPFFGQNFASTLRQSVRASGQRSRKEVESLSQRGPRMAALSVYGTWRATRLRKTCVIPFQKDLGLNPVDAGVAP